MRSGSRTLALAPYTASSSPASSGSSGGAAGRARDRGGHLPPGVDPERHPHPLVGRQARRHRLGQYYCRRVGLAMAGTLRRIRLAFIHSIRPHLIAPMYRDFPVSPRLNATSINGVGPGSAGHNSLQFGPRAFRTPGSTQPDLSTNPAMPSRPSSSTAHARTSAAVRRLEAHQEWFARSTQQPARTEEPAAARNALQDCITKVSADFHEVVTYQPASRSWNLQWYELAIYFAALSSWWATALGWSAAASPNDLRVRLKLHGSI